MEAAYLTDKHNKLGDKSFLATGPWLCNDLQPKLRRPELYSDSLRQSLKTYLWQMKRLVSILNYRHYTNKLSVCLSIYVLVSLTSIY